MYIYHTQPTALSSFLVSGVLNKNQKTFFVPAHSADKLDMENTARPTLGIVVVVVAVVNDEEKQKGMPVTMEYSKYWSAHFRAPQYF